MASMTKMRHESACRRRMDERTVAWRRGYPAWSSSRPYDEPLTRRRACRQEHPQTSQLAAVSPPEVCRPTLRSSKQRAQASSDAAFSLLSRFGPDLRSERSCCRAFARAISISSIGQRALEASRLLRTVARRGPSEESIPSRIPQLRDGGGLVGEQRRLWPRQRKRRRTRDVPSRACQTAVPFRRRNARKAIDLFYHFLLPATE